MILSYRFSNVFSYKDNVEFSMLAPSSKVKKRFEGNFVSTLNGYDINKTCVIVGENAGGKTNFVKSILYLKSLLASNDRIRAYTSTINSNSVVEANGNNSLDSEKLRQMFEIEILVNNKIFIYHLEIDLLGIVVETLRVKKNKTSRERRILEFTRKEILYTHDNDNSVKMSMLAELSFINEEQYDSAVIERMKKESSSGLFINKLAILGVEEAYSFIDWINNYLTPISYKVNLDFVKAIKNEEEDMDIITDPRFMEILRMIDYSIAEIEINDEDPYKKTMLVRKNKDGKEFRRELKDDSSGIGEYFAWAIQIFKVVYRNHCLIADEVDRVLNPVLSDRIVAFVNGKTHTGQLIFTTHNVLHLDLKNYMKEQIYFATKSIDTLESELYSLADFPEVRYEVTKIYEFYMKGILGGVANE